MGAVKTGEYVARYKIPGTRISCVFCDCRLETVEHLFANCPKLEGIRSEIKHYITEMGGVMEKTGDRLAFCTGLLGEGSSNHLASKAFNLLGECARLIWIVRNEVMFEQVEKDPVAKITGLVRATISRTRKEKDKKFDGEEEGLHHNG